MKRNLIKRILITNTFIGIFAVPIYILLKNLPFIDIFTAGVFTTFTILFISFYFLGVKFTGTWAILQKIIVTLPTSFVLSHLVTHIGNNLLLDYIVLFFVGYIISTPLIFLSYKLTEVIWQKKRN